MLSAVPVAWQNCTQLRVSALFKMRLTDTHTQSKPNHTDRHRHSHAHRTSLTHTHIARLQLSRHVTLHESASHVRPERTKTLNKWLFIHSSKRKPEENKMCASVCRRQWKFQFSCTEPGDELMLERHPIRQSVFGQQIAEEKKIYQHKQQQHTINFVHFERMNQCLVTTYTICKRTDGADDGCTNYDRKLCADAVHSLPHSFSKIV